MWSVHGEGCGEWSKECRVCAEGVWRGVSVHGVQRRVCLCGEGSIYGVCGEVSV